MKSKEQNIAIAKACGWAKYDEIIPCLRKSILPNYVNDLNAMHEAEKILFPKFEIEWHNQLQNVCGGSWRIMLNSSAAQRAEAFLRTLNLWKD